MTRRPNDPRRRRRLVERPAGYVLGERMACSCRSERMSEMAETLYASFPDPALAEQAAGALLDRGVRSEDLSLIASEAYARTRTDSQVAHEEVDQTEDVEDE